MGVFKEEASVFEAINFKQVRIFTDAADYGVPYNSKDVPGEVTAVFDVLADLKKLDAKFPKEKSLIRNRRTWGNLINGKPSGVSVDVIIFWEQEDGYDYGTKYNIWFDRISPTHSLIMKDADSVIAVDIERYKERT